MKRAARRRSSAAFTLVEAVLALVIVAVMLSAALAVAGAAAKARFAQQDSARGAALAAELLGQISQLAYAQPGAVTNVLGPEAGETRGTFNDVDDFNGYSESPPRDSAGAPLPAFAGWSRSVVVDWVAADAAGQNFVTSATETGMKRIRVTTTSPLGKSTTLSALRTRQSMYDKSLPVQATYTSWFGASMQIGANPDSVVAGGVNPVNQVP